MPVRWSSTHAMLYRSFVSKQCVTSFIQILHIRETDTTKKAGLAKLQMQASDWAEGAALHAKAVAVAKEIVQCTPQRDGGQGPTEAGYNEDLQSQVQALIDFSEFDARPTAAPETPASTSGDSLMERAFNKHLYGKDEMMDGQSVVEWWGKPARYGYGLPPDASLSRGQRTPFLEHWNDRRETKKLTPG
ncbi:hypothetical protein SISSUDRAFT_1132209 [Sistotremastrum suecicum HHB10207 ss-3]|uniref:Uncharacterized protein n=1 Tax=Sistotremastrum suecicum HHB10207 ss-3 TaxID=1314776 RepID=A0A165Z5C2_9AGAM|nr:hypothetical protein SISSUDRAFT_1132209 [Sistotremastrum suecicum HHB10207 ss-3]